MRLKTMAFMTFFILILSLPAVAGNRREELPAPRLFVPTDIADIAGKDKLEFRWDSAGSGFDHYDFSIYQGTEPYEPHVIFKEKVPAGITRILVDTKTFKVGEYYMWSLRYAGGKKSLKAYSVFKIKG